MNIMIWLVLWLLITPQTALAETYFKQEHLPAGINGVQALYYGDGSHDKPILFGSTGAVYRSDGKTNAEWNRVLRFDNTQAKTLKITMNDSESQVLVITSESVYFSDSGLKKWKKIFGSDSTAGEDVRDGFISQNKIGRIYIATGFGLYVSDNEGKSWKYYEFSESDSIFQIHESESGCWLTSETGIYEFSESIHQFIRKTSFNSRSVAVTQGNGNAYASIESQLLINPKRSFLFGNGQSIGYLDAGNQSHLKRDDNAPFQINSRVPRSSSAPLRIGESHLLYSRENKLFLTNIESGRESYLSVAPGSGLIRDLAYQAENDMLFIGTEGGMYSHENFAATQLYMNQAQFKSNFELQILEDLFANEPSIHQVQIVAMKYAEVHPEKIQHWRERADRAPWLPQVSVGFDYGVDQVIELDRGGTNDPDVFISGPDEKDFNYDIQFTWSLSELIWNPDQTSIDNRSKLMVQLREDLMSRVNASYFARRLLILEGAMDVQRNPLQLAKKALQIQELEAELDAMTGGYFTGEIRRLKKKGLTR